MRPCRRTPSPSTPAQCTRRAAQAAAAPAREEMAWGIRSAMAEAISERSFPVVPACSSQSNYSKRRRWTKWRARRPRSTNLLSSAVTCERSFSVFFGSSAHPLRMSARMFQDAGTTAAAPSAVPKRPTIREEWCELPPEELAPEALRVRFRKGLVRVRRQPQHVAPQTVLHERTLRRLVPTGPPGYVLPRVLPSGRRPAAVFEDFQDHEVSVTPRISFPCPFLSNCFRVSSS